MRFVDHVFDEQVIDSLTVKIILPEGAKWVWLFFSLLPLLHWGPVGTSGASCFLGAWSRCSARHFDRSWNRRVKLKWGHKIYLQNCPPGAGLAWQGQYPVLPQQAEGLVLGRVHRSTVWAGSLWRAGQNRGCWGAQAAGRWCCLSRVVWYLGLSGRRQLAQEAWCSLGPEGSVVECELCGSGGPLSLGTLPPSIKLAGQCHLSEALLPSHLPPGTSRLTVPMTSAVPRMSCTTPTWTHLAVLWLLPSRKTW